MRLNLPSPAREDEPDRQSVGSVVGKLREQRQGAYSGKESCRDAKIDRRDRKSGDCAGRRLVTPRQRSLEDDGPAEGEEQVKRHGGKREPAAASLVRQQGRSSRECRLERVAAHR